jgi:hypothetical protein
LSPDFMASFISAVSWSRMDIVAPQNQSVELCARIVFLLCTSKLDATRPLPYTRENSGVVHACQKARKGQSKITRTV